MFRMTYHARAREGFRVVLRQPVYNFVDNYVFHYPPLLELPVPPRRVLSSHMEQLKQNCDEVTATEIVKKANKNAIFFDKFQYS